VEVVERVLLQGLAEAEQERLKVVEAAWEAYHGDLPDPLIVQPGDPDDNIVLDFAAPLVDASRSFLFGREPEFVVPDDFPRNEDAQTYLDAVWQRNSKATLLQLISLNGGVSGHTFTKIVEENPPRLVTYDATVRTVWKGDDVNDVERFIIEWVETIEIEGRVRLLPKRQIIERASPSRWEIIDEEATPGTSDMVVKRYREVGRFGWERPWPPMVHCQNLPAPRSFYGISDLKGPIVKGIKALNFVLSNSNRILRLHAHPKVVTSGVEPEVLDVAADEAIVIPLDAKIDLLAPKVDLSSLVVFFDRLKETLHEIARVPEIALGQMKGVTPPSGVAMQILYRPLMDKTQDKRRLYGDMVIELNRRLLSIGGFGEEGFTEIVWPDPMPEDEEGKARTAGLKQDAGVSRATTLEEMGYDSEEEEAVAEEEKSKDAERAAATFNAGVGAPVA
jgi:hypothetical protein